MENKEKWEERFDDTFFYELMNYERYGKVGDVKNFIAEELAKAREEGKQEKIKEMMEKETIIEELEALQSEINDLQIPKQEPISKQKAEEIEKAYKAVGLAIQILENID